MPAAARRVNRIMEGGVPGNGDPDDGGPDGLRRRAHSQPLWSGRDDAATADPLWEELRDQGFDLPAPRSDPQPEWGRSWVVSSRAVVVLAVVAILVLIGVLVRAVVSGPDGVTEVSARSPLPASSTPSGSPAGQGSGSMTSLEPLAAVTASAAVLVVDVVGQVNRPGVVHLAEGARVLDAVNAAGGATARADLAAVNLARKVVDGEQIFVPRPGQAVPVPGPVTGTGPGSGSAGAAPVDLNTATEAELDALPGIGPVLAGRIVAWRQEHGRFTRVDELGEVSGIGDTLLKRLRPLVRV